MKERKRGEKSEQEGRGLRRDGSRISCAVTAMSSNAGKTVVTCALLEWLSREGFSTCAFKTGPDYIDPMFHRKVQGVECHNLDLFLCGGKRTEDVLRQHFLRYAGGYDAVAIEGAMGWKDGIGGTSSGSAWEIAIILDVRGLLVVNCEGCAGLIAATDYPVQEIDSGIAAVFLNCCGDEEYPRIKEAVEKKTGLPVIGYLPQMPEAEWSSRHLGLVTACEIDDLKMRLRKLGAALGERMDRDAFLAVFQTDRMKEREKRTDKTEEREKQKERIEARKVAEPTESEEERRASGHSVKEYCPETEPADWDAAKNPLLAVARDEAFCFIYEETLDALRDAGFAIGFFSPLHGENIPESASALLLSGGYPELYAKELAANARMRTSVRTAVTGGLPTIAECGGFLYLGEELQGTDGKMYPMCGAFRGKATRKERLVRFGYAQMTAKKDGLLFRKGESAPIHEFHYWDSTANGDDFALIKPVSDRSWQGGFQTPTMYAGFAHLYLAAQPDAVKRFREAAESYHRGFR